MNPTRELRALALVVCVLCWVSACADDTAPEEEPSPSTSQTSETSVNTSGTTSATSSGTSTSGTGEPDAGSDAEPDVAVDTSPDVADDDVLEDAEPDTDTPDVQEDAAPDVEEDTSGEDTAPDAPDVDCSTFRAVEDTYTVRAQTFVAIEAEGGSGSYTWSFPEDGNVTQAQLDPVRGHYISGMLAEGDDFQTDQVVVRDTVCEREETVRIAVVVDMDAQPARPRVSVEDSFCFEVTGGSTTQTNPTSPLVWSMSRIDSGVGASIDVDGCYTAGSNTGIDVVMVVDRVTGQTLQIPVQVVDDNSNRIQPSVRALALAQNDSFVLQLSSGSGSFTHDPARSVLGDVPGTRVSHIEGTQDRFLVQAGATSGRGSIFFADEFLNETISVPLNVMNRVDHPAPFAASVSSDDNDIIPVGDVNGDGYDDVVASVRTNGINGSQSGATFLYLGGFLGDQGRTLDTTPAQVLTGVSRNNFLGRSVAAGDFNGDGCNDIAVGVWGANPSGSQSGAVQIWTGCSSDPSLYPNDLTSWSNHLEDNLDVSLYPNAPLSLWKTIPGVAANDRFGWQLQTGDFDGDGLTDLAVSAYAAESQGRLNDEGNPVSNIGRIYLFTHQDGALSDLPSVTLDGLLVEEDGSLTPQTNTYIGYGDLSTGDINNDGCDDVLAGASINNGNRGFAALYLSIPNAEGPAGCIVSNEPSVFFHHRDGDRAGRIGWRNALTDVNGDCIPDVILSAPTQDIPANALNGTNNRINNDAGAIYVFISDPEWDPNSVLELNRDQAALALYAASSDNFAWGLSTGDVTGDGITDLLAGSRYGEFGESTSNVGVVRIFPGRVEPNCENPPEDVGPLFGDPLTVTNGYRRNGDLFGSVVSVIGDVSGDGIDDWAVVSPRGAEFDIEDDNDHRGGLYWHPGMSEEDYAATTYESLQILEQINPVWDDMFGQEIASVGDVNNDGFTDFVATAMQWDNMYPLDWGDYSHQRAGAAFLFLGNANGLSSTPSAIISGHPEHDPYDVFGYALSSAGDFNGDGFDDFVVTAIEEDLEGPCQPCRIGGTNRSAAGAAYVYFGRDSLLDGRENARGLEIPQINDPDVIFCGLPDAPVAGGFRLRLGREVSGGFDHDGDGYSDLLLSNWNYDRQKGVVWLMKGFAPEAGGGGPEVVCSSNAENQIAYGANNGDYTGHGIHGVDLNEDGCAEIVIGAYNGDPTGRNNAGILRVLMGHGEGCALSQPKTVYLDGDRAGDNLGRRIVPVGDVNGDGHPDLGVVSTGYGTGNIWTLVLFDGFLLNAAIAEVGSGERVRLEGALRIAEIADPEGVSGTNFGDGVASMGDVNGDGLGDFIVGASTSDLSGEINAGGAFIFLGSSDLGELVQPDVFIAGENQIADGRFGLSVAGARMGDSQTVVFMVGAPSSEREGPLFGEMGAVFTGQLSLSDLIRN